MSSSPTIAVIEEARERLSTLTGYLEGDPENINLRIDAAEAALDAGDPERAASLVDHHAVLGARDQRAMNLAGLAAMRLGRHEEAARAFSAIIEEGQAPLEVRFNLAWSRALLKDVASALALLDEEVTQRLPQAAMLEVQLLHQEGQLDEAMARARCHLERYPQDPGICAAVSVLAIDLEDGELAAACAAKAGDHPDALTSLATLELGSDNAAAAQLLFERALARNDRSPRAWIGRGLSRLMTGQADAAPADLDRGAELFDTHLGSWIAAGWAYFIAGDLVSARARFERALSLDPTFAESHGGLAVVDIAEGKLDAAGERAKVALRLDRECYGAAMARSLLAAAKGHSATASAILDRALVTPVDASGRTIAQSLARMGFV